MPRKRRAITDIRAYARQFTDLAMNTLVGVAGCKEAPHHARVVAAQGLLDRGWGKAPQTIEGEQTLRLVVERIERVLLDPKDVTHMHPMLEHESSKANDIKALDDVSS